jgi:hypothetical protein
VHQTTVHVSLVSTRVLGCDGCDVGCFPSEVRQRYVAAILNEPQEHDRSKPVDVLARFVRERVELSRLAHDFCATKQDSWRSQNVS